MAATDPSGAALHAGGTWSFRTALVGGSSFLDGATPAVLDSADPGAVELGVAFTTDRDITVHALSYYRGTEPGSPGTGSLWSADGTRLARVDFPAATGVGWHTAYLETPVHLAAGTTFTVSRYAPDGGYAHTAGDFSVPRTVGALTLAAENGRFRYGDGGAAPTQTWNDTNYFIDLLYLPE